MVDTHVPFRLGQSERPSCNPKKLRGDWRHISRLQKEETFNDPETKQQLKVLAMSAGRVTSAFND
jgi:hypothetical protein